MHLIKERVQGEGTERSFGFVTRFSGRELGGFVIKVIKGSARPVGGRGVSRRTTANIWGRQRETSA